MKNERPSASRSRKHFRYARSAQTSGAARVTGYAAVIVAMSLVLPTLGCGRVPGERFEALEQIAAAPGGSANQADASDEGVAVVKSNGPQNEHARSAADRRVVAAYFP